MYACGVCVCLSFLLVSACFQIISNIKYTEFNQFTWLLFILWIFRWYGMEMFGIKTSSRKWTFFFFFLKNIKNLFIHTWFSRSYFSFISNFFLRQKHFRIFSALEQTNYLIFIRVYFFFVCSFFCFMPFNNIINHRF